VGGGASWHHMIWSTSGGDKTQRRNGGDEQGAEKHTSTALLFTDGRWKKGRDRAQAGDGRTAAAVFASC
jgi:hypothetical protein